MRHRAARGHGLVWQLFADGAADLTRGGGSYACSRSGCPVGLPASARWEPPRGFPCQIRRGSGLLPVSDAARSASLLRVSRPAFGPTRSGSLSGSVGLAAESAARAARRAALKPVQEVLTDPREVAPKGSLGRLRASWPNDPSPACQDLRRAVVNLRWWRASAEHDAG